MDSKRIIKELGLKKFGVKGWLGGECLICEQCGKSDKTGILFTDSSGIFNCMRCGVKTSLNKYLKSLGLDHFTYKESVSVEMKRNISDFKGIEIESDINTQLPEKTLPVGSKTIKNKDKVYINYLLKRGFTQHHFESFKPVITNLGFRQKESIIFQIFDKENRRVAWLSRSIKSKVWHEENLKSFKEGKCSLKLRYDNSPNTDFSYILGGANEVADSTETVILVEGLFDKVNVDNKLMLCESDEIKCLFTFGDTIKQPQVDILKSFIGLKKVYLMYDYGTIGNSKQYGLILKEQLKKEIFVCEITWEGKDPGNLSLNEISEVIHKSVDPLGYNINKINHVK